VARNRCYDILRKERHLNFSEAPVDELPGKTGTPETILMDNEALDLVQTCLLELSLEERQLIVLRDLNGLSYSAVAEHLDTDIKKVKWKLYKARKRLGKLIGERYV
jgi:RNA polymerase sigma-70 factor (ECF subfamily)